MCLFGCRTEENVVPKGSFLMFQPTRSSSDKHPSEHKLCNILNKTECSVDIMHDKTQIYALHRYYIIDNLHLMKKIFAEKVRCARLCMLYIIYELFLWHTVYLYCAEEFNCTQWGLCNLLSTSSAFGFLVCMK